jgi:hypothetical protein
LTAQPHSPHVGLVVEGRGDAEAVPLLLRKWLERRGFFGDVLGKPVTCNGRDKALKKNGLEGKVAVAAARPGCVGVLVILDGEGDPVCSLGPSLLTRVSDIAVPVAVALADSQFESWLVASAESLSLPKLSYSPTQNAEAALKQALRPEKYAKPYWQPRLTHRLDFDIALPRTKSLRRALDRFDELFSALL